MARTRGAQAAGQVARERILAAATSLFAQNGYRGTSLAAVAVEAGLSQPGILHHFPNKKALLHAVLEGREAYDIEMLRGGLEISGGDLMSLLPLLPDAVQVNRRREQVIRLAHASIFEPEALAWEQARRERVRAAFEEAGRQSVASGTMRADANVPHVVATIIATFEGLENQWLVDPDFDMVEPMRLFVSILHRHLQP